MPAIIYVGTLVLNFNVFISVFMLLYVFLVDKLPIAVGKFHFWSGASVNSRDYVVAPCSNPRLQILWSKKIPELTSNTQIVLFDIDKDNVSDLVIGIGTGTYVFFLSKLPSTSSPPPPPPPPYTKKRNYFLFWEQKNGFLLSFFFFFVILFFSCIRLASETQFDTHT